MLNNDIEVKPGWTDPILEVFKTEKNTAIIQPKMLNYNDRKKFDYAGAAGGYLDKFGYPYCRGRLYNSIEIDNGQYDDVKEIFWACGACLFIRKKVFELANGFDNKFWAHMEEIDLCWRVQNLGYKIKYHYKSEVYHLNAGTLGQNSPKKTYLDFRNQQFNVLKTIIELKTTYLLYLFSLVPPLPSQINRSKK